MRLELDSGGASFAIRAYRPGEIVVNDEVLRNSFIITPEQLIRDWPPQRWQELEAHHFTPLVALAPEVVLLGTGSALHFPDVELGLPFMRRNIGFEVMDTGAACRSYAILMSEGRRVAAALLMIT